MIRSVGAAGVVVRLLAYCAGNPGSIPAAVAVFHVQAVWIHAKMEVPSLEASSLTNKDVKMIR